jgi:hypothetical protein
MKIRRALGLGVAAMMIVSAVPTLAQRNNNNRQQQQQQQQQRSQADPDTVTLVRLVDAVAMGQQPAPTDIPITWESNHFVKGQGGVTYIPFTLNVDRSQLPSPAVALYIRIANKNQPAAAPVPAAPAAAANNNDNRNRNNRNQQQQPAAPPAPTYAWDNIHFIDVPANGKLARAVALQPGEYDMFIALKERSTAPPAPPAQQKGNAPAAAAAPAPVGKMTVLRRDLTVPDFNKQELQTSSVILATTVEPVTGQLSPAEQEANPYVFGPMRIVPAQDGRFSKSQELQVIFWIYGASEAAGGKPDVQVEFNFYLKAADGAEKYFNKTEPQQLNAQTLPPEFSVAAGHQLPGSLVVGLIPFPTGDYRLEIKVTDKPSGKAVTQSVNFTVVPV